MNLVNKLAIKSHGANEAREYGCSSGLSEAEYMLVTTLSEKRLPTLALGRCPYKLFRRAPALFNDDLFHQREDITVYLQWQRTTGRENESISARTLQRTIKLSL